MGSSNQRESSAVNEDSSTDSLNDPEPTPEPPNIPFSHTFHRKVLVKIYCVLKPTYCPTDSQRNSSIMFPHNDTTQYSLAFKINSECFNGILPQSGAVIEEIGLDYIDNPNPFEIVVKFENFIFHYDLARLSTNITTMSTTFNIGQVLKDSLYRKSIPITIRMPKETTAGVNKNTIYRLFEDGNIRKEVVNLNQQKFGVSNFFTDLSVQQNLKTHVILTNGTQLMGLLTKWGIFDIPNLIIKDETPHGKQHSSIWSECTIPSSEISFIKSNRGQGLKIGAKRYYEAITNLCQKTGFSRWYPLENFNDCNVELSLTPLQTEMIISRLLNNQKVARVNNEYLTNEFVSFVMEVKGFY